ncbi:MAG TPA: protein phosphatase 2C domain-containing protein [Bryobacteraceae bacterium]|nr:protein phosphatase 2C domain-containing protein [Bryobacteraceae bacterium]
MELDYAQATDRGRVRDHNEDYIGCVLPEVPGKEQPHGWLFVLADGVGGQEKGEIASRTAVETLLAEFRRAGRDQPLRSLMPRLVQSANEKVFECGLAGKPRGAQMATTVVACALRHDRAVVSHVGDSRCYLIRGGRARSLTRDHTLVSEQERLGLISGRDAAEAETRHVLTRSLGGAMFVGADTAEHMVLADDILLQCSDGLHGAISAAAIAEIVTRNRDLEAAARELIDAANASDGGDNVSVQLIRVRSIERIGMYRGRPYKLA